VQIIRTCWTSVLNFLSVKTCGCSRSFVSGSYFCMLLTKEYCSPVRFSEALKRCFSLFGDAKDRWWNMDFVEALCSTLFHMFWQSRMVVVTPRTPPFLTQLFSHLYRGRFNWLGLCQVLHESNLISMASRKLQICNSHKLVIDTLNPCVGFGLIQVSGEGMRNGLVFVGVIH
jgi:hypothetical protein